MTWGEHTPLIEGAQIAFGRMLEEPRTPTINDVALFVSTVEKLALGVPWHEDSVVGLRFELPGSSNWRDSVVSMYFERSATQTVGAKWPGRDVRLSFALISPFDEEYEVLVSGVMPGTLGQPFSLLWGRSYAKTLSAPLYASLARLHGMLTPMFRDSTVDEDERLSDDDLRWMLDPGLRAWLDAWLAGCIGDRAKGW
jgi:hypothetical protein